MESYNRGYYDALYESEFIVDTQIIRKFVNDTVKMVRPRVDAEYDLNEVRKVCEDIVTATITELSTRLARRRPKITITEMDIDVHNQIGLFYAPEEELDDAKQKKLLKDLLAWWQKQVPNYEYISDNIQIATIFLTQHWPTLNITLYDHNRNTILSLYFGCVRDGLIHVYAFTR